MFIQWLRRLFKRKVDFIEPEPEMWYADYICALPTNWIAGDEIKMDIRYMMEQNELRIYADTVRNLNLSHSESLIKNTSEGRFV